jgi:hypothetical protein
MEQRTETRVSATYGRKFFLGEKFTLHKRSGSIQEFMNRKREECYINKISPSGNFFKVNISDKVFSIKTLKSNGSTLSKGFFLTINQ